MVLIITETTFWSIMLLVDVLNWLYIIRDVSIHSSFALRAESTNDNWIYPILIYHQIINSIRLWNQANSAYCCYYYQEKA